MISHVSHSQLLCYGGKLAKMLRDASVPGHIGCFSLVREEKISVMN